MPENVKIQLRRGTDDQWSSVDPVLSSGEPCFNTDTGAFKIGDGASKFSELPDYRNGKFRSVVTVSKTDKFADFCCADAQYEGDDAACIQAALNAANSGDILLILQGDYHLTSRVTQSNKNINIIGQGIVNIYLDTTDGSHGGIYFSGAVVTQNGSISQDTLKNSFEISITDASSIHTGDLIKIWNDALWCPLDYTTYTEGEMYRVKSINGNTLTLNDPLVRDYLLTDTVTFEIYRPNTINIKNINVYDKGTSDDRTGVWIQYGINCNISKSYFYGSGVSCLSLYSCYNCNVFDNHISTAIRDGAGYGIGVWNASAYIYIYKNYIENCRHAISGNSSELHALVRKIFIYLNTLVGATIVGSNVVDAHPVCIDYYVYDNVIYPKYGYFAFIDGCLYSEFCNNKIYGGNGAVTRRGNINNGVHFINDNYAEHQTTQIIAKDGEPSTGYSATYFATNTGIGTRIEICRNTQIGGNYGVAFKYNEIFENILIDRNNFSNIYAQGILCEYAQNGQNVIVRNNNISKCGYGGISLDANTFINGIIDVSNNIINQGWTTTGGSNVSIALNVIQNATIFNNKILDSTNNLRYGVYEGTGCNNNNISQNKISGFSIKGIYKTGANTRITQNDGYLTENTGTATVPATTTSIVVSHGLAAAPTNVSVTPKGNIGWCWVDTYTATTFIIHCSTAPVSGVDVNWTAIV